MNIVGNVVKDVGAKVLAYGAKAVMYKFDPTTLGGLVIISAVGGAVNTYAGVKFMELRKSYLAMKEAQQEATNTDETSK